MHSTSAGDRSVLRWIDGQGPASRGPFENAPPAGRRQHGQRQSIFIKALAASLIAHNTPEELKLIAIDPKMVELSHLNGLPHLLGSAETDVERGLRVLRWVAHEMDERYKLFSKAVARNLDEYNACLAPAHHPRR